MSETIISANFAWEKDASLESLENGIRAVLDDIKTYMAILAIALGRIRRQRLFLRVTRTWKDYLELTFPDLSYGQACSLATSGEAWWHFRQEFAENGIDFAQHVTKAARIDYRLARSVPGFWPKFSTLSISGFVAWQDRARNKIDYVAAIGDASVAHRGASLYIDDIKLRGLNLNTARKEIHDGKKLVPFWATSEAEAKRIRRAVESRMK